MAGVDSPDTVVAARELVVAGVFREVSSGTVDFSEEVAAPSTKTPAHERDRTNSRLHIALPEPNETKPAVTCAVPAPVVECIAPAVTRV